ncbi:DedA family protein [bacterium]|nr:DedA family protein [bacterium]
MIENIVVWLTSLIESTGYLGVGLAMFIESFFAPIPSELILPFAGFVASRTDQVLIISILVASVCAYLGSLPFYFLGVWGEDFVNRSLKKYGKYLFIQERDVKKGFEVFERYGSGIIFFGRLMPIIRTVISFPAGVAKTPFLKFSIYTLLGSTIWSALLAGAGYLLGERWELVGVWLSKYENVVIVTGIVVVVAYILFQIMRSTKEKSVD